MASPPMNTPPAKHLGFRKLNLSRPKRLLAAFAGRQLGESAGNPGLLDHREDFDHPIVHPRVVALQIQGAGAELV